MEGLRQYIGSIICMSLISGILLSLVQEQTGKAVLKLLCGAALTLTVVSPLCGLSLDDLGAALLPDGLDAEDFTAEGENMARENLARLIKQEAEAYILDKATSLHADVHIEISLSEDSLPVPVGAVLSGTASPYARQQLEGILQKDLGIPKENVQWTG